VGKVNARRRRRRKWKRPGRRRKVYSKLTQ
jgi:hypothetical protein